MRTKPLIGTYVVNARPLVGAVGTYHNCISSLDFTYEGKLREMHFCSDSRDLVDLFFEELTANAIPYELRRVAPNDVPAFAEP